MVASMRKGCVRRSPAVMLLACCLCCLIALFAACGPSYTAAGTEVQAATPTPTSVPPVTITLAAHQTGTIAAGTVALVVHVTVTNHTTATVAITDWPGCPPDANLPLIMRLFDAQGHLMWVWTSAVDCTLEPYYDIAHILPGGLYSRTETLALLQVPGRVRPVQAGQRYTLVADALLWHQGTISATGKTTSLHGYASGQTTIVLQS